jgi:multiple antibiotic resistance protein
MHAGGFIEAFLLAFPALISMVNPIGGALIFHEVVADRTAAERSWLVGRVAFYGMLIILVSLWAGSYVLNFFGISLGALRIAGGLVVATRAWALLTAPEVHEARKQEQAERAEGAESVAFYPLTMPFTTGPGTISVAVALGSERPASGVGLLYFFVGVSLAAVAVAVCIWVAYRFAGRVVGLLGPNGSRILTRLMAFLLLSIGIQILVTGVEELVAPWIGK